MEQNKTLNFKLVMLIKFVGFFILFYLSNKAGINGLIYPFIFGLYFALIWCNQNVFFVSLIYILSGYLATFSINNLIINVGFCVIFSLIYLIHYKIKKPFKLLHILIYACICNIPKIAMEIAVNNANIYIVFAEFFIGLLYTFACMKFFECVCISGVCNRLTGTEIICFGIFVVALFCGIGAINIYQININTFFVSLILLITSYITNLTTTLLLSSLMGVGNLIYNNNPTFLSICILFALTVSILKTKNKYITIVGLIVMDFLCGFYLKLYPAYSAINVIPIITSCLIYILFPSRVLDKYSNEFLDSSSSIIKQSVINRNREMLYYRLVELSDVFGEMNRVFRGMISGGVANQEAKRMLIREVRMSNCKDCPNHNKCYRVFNDETINALNKIVDSGFEKGKVNLLDVPTLFAGKCEKLNNLVSSVNDLINQYKNYAGLVNNIDASKVLLAEQLGGVSSIMKDLSKEVNKGVNFEKGKEKRIIDELTYNNIICSDALVFQDNEHILSVTLAVRNEDANNLKIEKVVSKICGHKMELYDDISSTRAGFRVVSLKSAPKYDLIFGIATKSKTGSIKSGDSFSVIKIKEGKYLFAICDGMGSGEKAEQTSSTALGLLENFYKAGFDKEIIISSVNKLLSLGKDDVFSALDLCVVDARSGIGDFIKMGAPESFIKHKDTTEIINIGALPMGIIQNAESKSKQSYFSSGDKIILVSDGISDNFKSVTELQDFINNLTAQNPQTLADQIMQRVLNDNNNIARDDMTVIVAKIFEK